MTTIFSSSRHLVRVRVLELLDQRRHDLGLVPHAQAARALEDRLAALGAAAAAVRLGAASGAAGSARRGLGAAAAAASAASAASARAASARRPRLGAARPAAPRRPSAAVGRRRRLGRSSALGRGRSRRSAAVGARAPRRRPSGSASAAVSAIGSSVVRRLVASTAVVSVSSGRSCRHLDRLAAVACRRARGGRPRGRCGGRGSAPCSSGRRASPCETSSGWAMSRMPPCWIFGARSVRPCVWRGLVWRLAMLRPSTTTETGRAEAGFQ